MDDEIDTVSGVQTDFQKSSSPVRTDQHREVVESKNSDRVLIGVENVVIGNAMLPRTVEDDRIHAINLS